MQSKVKELDYGKTVLSLMSLFGKSTTSEVVLITKCRSVSQNLINVVHSGAFTKCFH